MEINLSEKISEHFKRVEDMAIEASEDADEKYSSRASAMSAVTTMLSQLTAAQESIFNMERLMRIEKVTIESVNEFLTDEQKILFEERLEELLSV